MYIAVRLPGSGAPKASLVSMFSIMVRRNDFVTAVSALHWYYFRFECTFVVGTRRFFLGIPIACALPNAAHRCPVNCCRSSACPLLAVHLVPCRDIGIQRSANVPTVPPLFPLQTLLFISMTEAFLTAESTATFTDRHDVAYHKGAVPGL